MGSRTIEYGHGYLEAIGGVRLHYRSWDVEAPRAALAVLHELGAHSGRQEELGGFMAERGVATFALDLRGHGSSEGRRGHARHFEVLLQDMDRFRRELLGLVDPSCPLFLLGHGLGALIAIRYLEEYEAPFRGAILVAPWLAGALRLPRWKASAAAFFSRLLPALPLRAGIRPQDLSHDRDVVATFAGDPQAHDRITPRLFTEASAAMGVAFRRTDRLLAPLLLLLPGDDRLADTAGAQRFAAAIPAADVTIRVYPGLHHDLLAERERDAIRDEVLRWIAARI